MRGFRLTCSIGWLQTLYESQVATQGSEEEVVRLMQVRPFPLLLLLQRHRYAVPNTTSHR